MKKSIGFAIAVIVAIIVFAAIVYATMIVKEPDDLELTTKPNSTGKTIKLNLNEGVGLGDTP